MKKALLASILLSWLICAVSGCAYTAHVKGVMGPEQQAEIPAGALICVAVDPDADEEALSEEITGKLEMLLAKQGYRSSNSSDAEYFLFFDFRRKSLITRVGLEPQGGIRSGIKTYEKEGPYDLTISLRLVKASAYHDTGLQKFVWAGGAILSSTPTESSKFADLLLVAAMKYFPMNTAEVRKIKIGLYDFRARHLRR